VSCCVEVAGSGLGSHVYPPTYSIDESLDTNRVPLQSCGNTCYDVGMFSSSPEVPVLSSLAQQCLRSGLRHKWTSGTHIHCFSCLNVEQLLLFIIMYVRPSTCPEIPENSNLFLYVLKVVSLSWILWYPFLNVVLFTNVTFCLFRPTCGLLRHYVWPVCPLMHACVHAWQRYSLTCLPWTSNYYPIFVTIYFSTEKILYVHMYIESLV